MVSPISSPSKSVKVTFSVPPPRAMTAVTATLVGVPGGVVAGFFVNESALPPRKTRSSAPSPPVKRMPPARTTAPFVLSTIKESSPPPPSNTNWYTLASGVLNTRVAGETTALSPMFMYTFSSAGLPASRITVTCSCAAVPVIVMTGVAPSAVSARVSVHAPRPCVPITSSRCEFGLRDS
jgi:hypothetical protein